MPKCHGNGWYKIEVLPHIKKYFPFSFKGGCTQTCFKPPNETVCQIEKAMVMKAIPNEFDWVIDDIIRNVVKSRQSWFLMYLKAQAILL